MDPRDQLDVILPLLNDLVAPLTAADLGRPTPCTQFAVRDVLEHMVGGASQFAAAFRGDGSPGAGGEADALATFPQALADLAAAVRSPGALERTISAPFGEVPGEVFARFVALDGLIHGWDIATATGQKYDPPAAVVADVDAFAREAISQEMRDGGTFATAVTPPIDASPLVRLAAFTGRDV